MKILQLTNKIPYPPKDGGAIATLNISTGLASLGHKMTMLGMNTSKHFFNLGQLPAHIAQLVDMREVELDTSISVVKAAGNLLFSKKPYNAERFNCPNFRKALIRLLKTQKFDIIQLEGLYLTWYIDTIRQHSNALIALRAHNIEHEIWERVAQQEKNPIKKYYFNILAKRIRRLELEALNTYDLLLPITNRDAEHYTTLGNKRPWLTVPVGFITDYLTPKPEKIRFPNVFFIGTLDWFPNQEGLIWFLEKVWPDLLATFPDLKFHVAGRNAPETIEALLDKSPNVEFHGEIDDAQQFINQNAILVAPLFSGSGMRVKIIEGMALQKTIVTTTIGAEGIDVMNNENILIADDETDFTNAIKTLVHNRKLFESIGRNALEFVKTNYDNQKISMSLASFYQTHIDKK